MSYYNNYLVKPRQEIKLYLHEHNTTDTAEQINPKMEVITKIIQQT